MDVLHSSGKDGVANTELFQGLDENLDFVKLHL